LGQNKKRRQWARGREFIGDDQFGPKKMCRGLEKRGEEMLGGERAERHLDRENQVGPRKEGKRKPPILGFNDAKKSSQSAKDEFRKWSNSPTCQGKKKTRAGVGFFS